VYRVVDVANGVYRDPLIRPERVNDWELGASWRGSGASATANVFRMTFHDELVYAGQFDTDLGYPILGNAARSVHQGIELSAGVERGFVAGSNLAVQGNVSLSDHHFVEYREVYGTSPGDTVRYDGNAIGFFPATLANLEARWTWRAVTLGADVQHAGRIFLDATESEAASIAPRTVLGLRAEVGVPLGGGARADLAARVFNVRDTRYETSGYMDYDAAGDYVPHFVPAAGRNALVQLRVSFR
jgi:outer membrane receptor protein involved in Fe transport